MRMTGDRFEGKCVGNVRSTPLNHEAFSDGRSTPHNVEDSVAWGQSFELAVPLTSVKRDCAMAAQRNPSQHPRSRLRSGHIRGTRAGYPGGTSRQSQRNRECFSLVQTGWRRGRDLNSRTPCEVSSFQDWHVRPLRHPSIFQISWIVDTF